MILTNFTTVQGYSCIFGNIYNALHYIQMNVKEQDLFFWFSPFQGSKNIYEMIDIFYEKIDKNEWQNFVKQSIEEKKPVLVRINPNSLPYIRHSTFDSSKGHYINIIGIDVSEKKICVSDSFVPTLSNSTYTGWIDYSTIVNVHIDTFWQIKYNLIYKFLRKCEEEEIINFTYFKIISRLRDYLEIDYSNEYKGISELQKLPNLVGEHVQNKNYIEIYKMLAGVRLNIINPLVYLSHALQRNHQYQDLAKSLDAFVGNYWESLNMKLVKFSVAHKPLDGKCIATEIEDAVFMERAVLKSIIERLLIDTDVISEKMCYLDKFFSN